MNELSTPIINAQILTILQTWKILQYYNYFENEQKIP